MADTFTAKLGLRQYDASLFYDVSKFSADNLLVDNAFGTVICTSTTRPSTGLFNGMTLWETDTRRFVVRVAGAWTVVPGRAIIADQTARAAITTPYDGMVIWRQDRDWHEVYDGAAWRVMGTGHCASVADRDGASGITNPFNGQVCITQDTDTFWTYDSSAWIPIGGKSFPRGTVGEIKSATNHTGINSEVVLSDVITATLVSGRKYMSTWEATFDTSNPIFRMRYQSGASVTTSGTQYAIRNVSGTGGVQQVTLMGTFTAPSSGQFTVGVTAAGTGLNVHDSSTNKRILELFDIGG